MKDKKVTSEEMKDVKGGFNPVFEVSAAVDEEPVVPQVRFQCYPPPYTNSNCIRCESVWVPFD